MSRSARMAQVDPRHRSEIPARPPRRREQRRRPRRASPGSLGQTRPSLDTTHARGSDRDRPNRQFGCADAERTSRMPRPPWSRSLVGSRESRAAGHGHTFRVRAAECFLPRAVGSSIGSGNQQPQDRSARRYWNPKSHTTQARHRWLIPGRRDSARRVTSAFTGARQVLVGPAPSLPRRGSPPNARATKFRGSVGRLGPAGVTRRERLEAALHRVDEP